ncbi:olfactomedin-4-like [Esox lucius]|uniref:Olfactomedin-like domain-containing protein n=1 Tax=Esox lucius TaxID=8010 RepID=A0A3P8Y5C1_ESOLU|nr:olfactomedin-4-like [Esox lucius]
MLIFLLLLTTAGHGDAQRFNGLQKDDSCSCKVNSSVWAFPTVRFEGVQQLVEECGESLKQLQAQVMLSTEMIPKILATFNNLTARLEPYQYLNNLGLYTPLQLRQLAQELTELEKDIASVHNLKPSHQTQELTNEISKVRKKVDRMHLSNTFNMKTVKEKLRTLKNGVETCRTIPEKFISKQGVCSQRIMSNISTPVSQKISPFGKSYVSGSWGRQAKKSTDDEEVIEDFYWVQPLVSSNRLGNVVRRYKTYDDFMASRNQEDVSVAPSYSHANAIQGSGTVVYGNAVFFNCYMSTELCRYDLQTKATRRLNIPDLGANNQFPYCYYNCKDWTDVDFAVDETGLWVIYTTLGNHGNLMLSRLDSQAFNVTHTWTTRLFKKSVTNAFMVCGVLYATRYVDRFREEVFYAFDTATGQDDNTLALPLEKIEGGVASLTYNPIDRQLYMYNEGYLLSYKAIF